MVKFIKVFTFALMIWLVTVGAAFAVTRHDHVMYYITTGETLTAGWDAVDTAVSYDFQVLRFEWNKEVIQEWTSIGGLTQVFTVPKSGIYIIRVRAVNAAGVASAWSSSTNAGCSVVEGAPRSWWVYGYTAPPGPIDINLGKEGE